MGSELYLKKISELSIYAFHCSLTFQLLDRGLICLHPIVDPSMYKMLSYIS